MSMEAIEIGAEVFYQPGEYGPGMTGTVQEIRGSVVDLYIPEHDVIVYSVPQRTNSQRPQNTWVPILEKSY